MERERTLAPETKLRGKAQTKRESGKQGPLVLEVLPVLTGLFKHLSSLYISSSK